MRFNIRLYPTEPKFTLDSYDCFKGRLPRSSIHPVPPQACMIILAAKRVRLLEDSRRLLESLPLCRFWYWGPGNNQEALHVCFAKRIGQHPTRFLRNLCGSKVRRAIFSCGFKRKITSCCHGDPVRGVYGSLLGRMLRFLDLVEGLFLHGFPKLAA